MNKLFCGDHDEWNFVFIYLDDILVVSATIEEHIAHVRKVLCRLDEAGLRLKPSKCKFARQEIEYLGFTLSPEGVKLNSLKVRAVQEFPQPKYCKSVKQFLGLVNFYRRHIPNLAAIARPLTALTRRDKSSGGWVAFDWTPQCEQAFQRLKKLLITAPVLQCPDLSKPFFLWTDASEAGFGAILEQEGEDNPIAYVSRQTNDAEK